MYKFINAERLQGGISRMGFILRLEKCPGP